MENTNIKHHTLSVHVNNKPGVLMRICQVFSRRGYNIESLVVSHGRHNSLSRMTIGVEGEKEKLGQIIQQMNKLIDVIHCTEHDDATTLNKELALVKIKINQQNFVDVSNVVVRVDGKIVDKQDNYIIASIVGDSSNVDWSVKMLSQFEVTETIRTGKIVMAKSDTDT